MNDKYTHEHKENRPVLAICYDFDKTLSPNDMQAQGYIQSVGLDVGDFWKKSNGLAGSNDMDQNLAYMYMMKKTATGKHVFTRQALKDYGTKIKLYQGVESWFKRINEYGMAQGVIVEHYIISSGLKEIIEGTSIAQEFKGIYACSYYYDEDGVAVWPAQVINYTNKTQFLFRIEKGMLDINDQGVNDPIDPDEVRVPFRNMVYIGDSDTDVPCMKLVNSYGGYSIGVYSPETRDKTKVYKMMRDERIKYFAPADYSEGEEVDRLLKLIIDRTAANEKLEYQSYVYKKEQVDADSRMDEEAREKTDLIVGLESSRSFINTHSIIEKLQGIKKWTQEEREALFSAALGNSQVRYILCDYDVKAFYVRRLHECKELSVVAQQVKEIIEKP